MHNDLFDMRLETKAMKYSNAHTIAKHEERQHTERKKKIRNNNLNNNNNNTKTNCLKLKWARVLARCDRGNDDFAVFTFVG